MKPIDILLYEDNQAYKDSFKLKAQQKRIIVDHVDNVDELLERLEGNPRKHKFVILDARAFLHEGQTQGTESEANLHKIFREIDKISKIQDRVIQYCINTGFAEIKLQYEEVLKCCIFEKGNEDELLQYVWDSYNNTEGAKLRMGYPDLYDFVDTYFDDANSEILSNVLLNKKFESSSIVDRINNLANLRRLIEHTMDILFNCYLNQLDGIVRNRATRASDIINHLNSNGKVPSQIFGNVVNILKTASNYGSHTPEQAAQIAEYPDKNSIIGLTFGFIATISWAQKLLN